MLSDIEIAQNAKMKHIRDVAASIGIAEDDLEFYGKYKAKIASELWGKVKDNENGKLILVTAINPTPAGEGKTTTTIGLGDALTNMGKKCVLALRERHSDLLWELKAVLQAAVTVRLYDGGYKSSFYR